MATAPRRHPVANRPATIQPARQPRHARIRTRLHENDALHRLAAIIQFTYPGVPCIYYGDEIGMVDHPKLDQRGCMIWQPDRWNHDLRTFYQNLIALRKTAPALQSGGIQFLDFWENGFCFARTAPSSTLIVVANRHRG